MKPPRRSKDPWDAAEAVFKPARAQDRGAGDPKPVASGVPQPPSELVSLRLDQDVRRGVPGRWTGLAGPHERRAAPGRRSLTAAHGEVDPLEAPARGEALRGIGLSALGYGLFSVQDATVKWLVVSVPVPEILFVRSLVIMSIAVLIGRGAAVRALSRSRRKTALAVRAALMLTAWLCYYNAAAHLELAELTTLYFAAPIIAVVLATVVLKERIVVARWLAVGVGFCGVMLAADPKAGGGLSYVGLALFAACCWGSSVVLVRLISRTETTAAQMLVSNGLFAAACLPMSIWLGHIPTLPTLALMLGLGVCGGLGQWFLYEGFRSAPASAVAPVEYTGLLWAFVYGYAIWGEIPAPRVFAGAAVIVVASVLLIVYEARRTAPRVARANGADAAPDESDHGTTALDRPESA